MGLRRVGTSLKPQEKHTEKIRKKFFSKREVRDWNG